MVLYESTWQYIVSQEEGNLWHYKEEKEEGRRTSQLQWPSTIESCAPKSISICKLPKSVSKH